MLQLYITVMDKFKCIILLKKLLKKIFMIKLLNFSEILICIMAILHRKSNHHNFNSFRLFTAKRKMSIMSVSVTIMIIMAIIISNSFEFRECSPGGEFCSSSGRRRDALENSEGRICTFFDISISYVNW